MTDDSSRGPNRREFLVVGGAAAASLAFVASTGMSAAATGCTDGSCSTTTVWMLEPDWGYAWGPHAKTRLISRASRGAAANRVARTEADALDMNLHRCSFAPAVAVSVCAPRGGRVRSLLR